MRTASAASSNLFKKSVPILKKAAAADARAKRGELAAVGEAVEMYGEGIALLEQAIDSPDFNDKVRQGSHSPHFLELRSNELGTFLCKVCLTFACVSICALVLSGDSRRSDGWRSRRGALLACRHHPTTRQRSNTRPPS